ncbi:hypothetical protein GMRT_15503 [Giardia muris]|uniref:Protein kish n=1 Tax=Giardia muris TaxID=5742 RepID=A0A4Z1T2E9_GIAMU|nr:hypothetical protein GMRT_15503 [Giardia muris]|eukprot:TNJ29828.1 hypothetical protein GMRT_15503 [Giardia muris]
MTKIWCLDGFAIALVLVVCCCSYLARMPRLKGFVLREKTGLRGTLYKCALIGIRLDYAVALSCVLLGLYRLFL